MITHSHDDFSLNLLPIGSHQRLKISISTGGTPWYPGYSRGGGKCKGKGEKSVRTRAAPPPHTLTHNLSPCLPPFSIRLNSIQAALLPCRAAKGQLSKPFLTC